MTAGTPYVNMSCTELGLDTGPEFVTVTSTVPAVPLGLVAVHEVELGQLWVVAAVEPNVIVDVLVNPFPLIATEVPPPVAPAVGLMSDTEGPL